MKNTEVKRPWNESSHDQGEGHPPRSYPQCIWESEAPQRRIGFLQLAPEGGWGANGTSELIRQKRDSSIGGTSRE